MACENIPRTQEKSLVTLILSNHRVCSSKTIFLCVADGSEYTSDYSLLLTFVIQLNV